MSSAIAVANDEASHERLSGAGLIVASHFDDSGLSSADFAKRLDTTADETEQLLDRLLSDALCRGEIARPQRLVEAMRYPSLGGGKRLRPFLVGRSRGAVRRAARRTR